MTAKATIADVLHLAADMYLWDGNTERYKSNVGLKRDVHGYAVIAALRELDMDELRAAEVFNHLETISPDSMPNNVFDDLPCGAKRQAARYAWLKFAALIAEEQGV